MNARRFRSFGITFAVLAFVAVAVFAPLRRSHYWSGEAFAAFYCAGVATAAGRSPRTIEPLAACEARVEPGRLPRGGAEPAPLPGYALVPFVALAHLPYVDAAAVFVVASMLGLALAATALAACTGLSALEAIAPFAVLGVYVCVFYGETPPLALGAICCCGWAVRAGRDRVAGAVGALAMLEPHVGVAVCASLFAWRRRSRLTLFAAGAALVGVWLAVSGPRSIIVYFRTVLPLQARAETSASDQYSLTWLAHVAGASDHLATSLGSASYVAIVLAAVLLARRISRGFEAPELIAFFPAAASVFLGVFIHDVDLPFAAPALLVVACAMRSRTLVPWLALVVLGVAWMPWWFGDRLALALALVAAGSLGFSASFGRSVAMRGAFAAAACLICAATIVAVALVPAMPFGAPATPWPSLGSLIPGDYAALAWGAVVRGGSVASSDQTLRLLAGKIVVWVALGGMLAFAAYAASLRPDHLELPTSSGESNHLLDALS